MTRAINVRATEAEITRSCQKQGVLISAMETLVSGGTRVVLTNIEAADKMRQVFGAKVVTGAVRRMPLRSFPR